jgi:hypothetical protein
MPELYNLKIAYNADYEEGVYVVQVDSIFCFMYTIYLM